MNEQNTATILPLNSEANASASDAARQTNGHVKAKLADAGIPGYQAEFDPDEAEAAGAFQEDALSEADALDSTQDSAHPAERSLHPRVHPLFWRN